VIYVLCFDACLFIQFLYLPLSKIQTLFDLLASAQRKLNCTRWVKRTM
jgi:hypothetical protein